MGKKKRDDRPLPPMFVGDSAPPGVERPPEQQSPVPADTLAEEQARKPTGPAAADPAEYPNTGCMLYLAGVVSIIAVVDWAEVPEPNAGRLLVLAPLLVFGLYLWNTARDADVAEVDRLELHPIADLRNWLRRVLKIRVR